MKVLITGATGFVGKALCIKANDTGVEVTAAVREVVQVFSKQIQQVKITDLSKKVEWESALKGVSVVVHVAARAHIMNDSMENSLSEFRKVNTEGSLNLARQAADAGVKRFIFISSVKVNGEITGRNAPMRSDKKGGARDCFNENDVFIPTDPYGLSKYEAERGLLALTKETGMEVVIIRPPLVYGPGVRANFASMLKWAKRGVPLPLGAVHNQRSLVALDNLINFIIHCIAHPKAANEVFLISDGEDVSTTELLQKVAKAFGKKSRLIPVPVYLLTLVAKLIGKSDVASRLFGSLQVDSTKARELLGWKPVITMDEELKEVASAYLAKQKI
jgi:nucleoside-diphosphate-sugar epimerase